MYLRIFVGILLLHGFFFLACDDKATTPDLNRHSSQYESEPVIDIAAEEDLQSTPSQGEGYRFVAPNESEILTQYFIPKNYLVNSGNQFKIKFWEGNIMRIESDCPAGSCQVNKANIHIALEKIKKGELTLTR